VGGQPVILEVGLEAVAVSLVLLGLVTPWVRLMAVLPLRPVGPELVLQ
jgi:hypothetical protein